MAKRQPCSSIRALLPATTALLLSLIAVITGGKAFPDASSAAASEDMSTQHSATSTRQVTIELVEMEVRPGTLEIPSGTRLVVNVVNQDEVRHDLKLLGRTGTRLLAPGERQTVSFGVVTHDVDAWCTVPGHKAAGMVLHVHVTGSVAGGATGGNISDGVSSRDSAWAATNRQPATEWRPYDPTLRPAPRAREHRLTIRVIDRVLEVAPGVRQRLWTFNGTVPGPVLRGHVGDLFTVTFVNDGTTGHSIDFHASEVAPSRLMRTIDPGQRLVYQFRAQRAGVWMYHCATPPMLYHIGSGMYGALIVDPRDLARVDRELVFVQSEFYLGPPGKLGDLAKMRRAEPDLVVFNGYASQYTQRPVRVRVGERLRIWLLDAGPNTLSAFHVIGSVFQTVYTEGAYRLHRGPGGAQVLALAPAEGGFVELTLREPGRYPFVTHRLSDADRGARGLFEAV